MSFDGIDQSPSAVQRRRLLLPNVLPRYLHFLTASIALTALFLVRYTGRKAFPVEGFEDLGRDRIRRSFYKVALGATALQLFFGPLLFITLPAHTITAELRAKRPTGD